MTWTKIDLFKFGKGDSYLGKIEGKDGKEYHVVNSEMGFLSRFQFSAYDLSGEWPVIAAFYRVIDRKDSDRDPRRF